MTELEAYEVLGWPRKGGKGSTGLAALILPMSGSDRTVRREP